MNLINSCFMMSWGQLETNGSGASFYFGVTETNIFKIDMIFFKRSCLSMSSVGKMSWMT